MQQKGVPTFASQLETSANTVPAKDHPIRKRLFELGQSRPTPSLELWFDAGLMFAAADDDEDVDAHVKGYLGKPAAYTGCSEESVLLECRHNGIKIWPVRFDLGEEGWEIADPQRPWTLYHYTHSSSFEAFAMTFGKLMQRPDADPASDRMLPALGATEVRKMIVAQLAADYADRNPYPSASNPNAEPELTLMEPQQFESKEQVVKNVFGKIDLQAYSVNHGHRYGEFADYCIAFQVPQCCCINTPGDTAEQQQSSLVRINPDSLESLRRRAHAQVELEAARTKFEGKAVRKGDGSMPGYNYNRKPRPGCLGFLCGSFVTTGDFYEDEEEKADKEQAEEENVPKKKEMEQWKKKIQTEWVKEHFLSVTKRKADEAKHKEELRKIQEEQEEKRRQKEMEKMAHQGPVFRAIETPAKSNKKKTDTQSTVLPGATALMEVFEARKHQQEENAHLNMYMEHRRKQMEDKELARGADKSLKGKRSNSMNARTSSRR